MAPKKTARRSRLSSVVNRGQQTHVRKLKLVRKLALVWLALSLAGLALNHARWRPSASAQMDTAAQQGEGRPGARGGSVRPKRQSTRTPQTSGAKTSKAGALRSLAEASSEASADGPTAEASLDTSSSPVLAVADFDLVGLAVTASPATQTVPKNTPTAVLTGLRMAEGGDAAALTAGLNPNYRVRGELTGPSFSAPRVLEAPIGQPLPVPPLTQAGEHVVQNLRVVDIATSEETVVAPVTPDACGIVVIERILISQVRVNELSYEQIRQAGINISDDSYQAFNFTLGVGTTAETQSISIPVAFPSVGVTDPRPVMGTPTVSGPGVDLPTVVPVMLTPEGGEGEGGGGAGGGGGGGGQLPTFNDEPVRIPGVIVFPGRVGFLNQ
ncbi:MAG TPA: hypothetical protein VGV38_06975, partial [Pyrinomonadaceae bacterium]|nr:hypothetical protein [Pyrinomonadaceae bacterium]